MLGTVVKAKGQDILFVSATKIANITPKSVPISLSMWRFENSFFEQA